MKLEEALNKAKEKQEQETNKYISYYVSCDNGFSCVNFVEKHSRSPQLDGYYRLYPMNVIAGDVSIECPLELVDEDCWDVYDMDWEDW